MPGQGVDSTIRRSSSPPLVRHRAFEKRVDGLLLSESRPDCLPRRKGS